MMHAVYNNIMSTLSFLSHEPVPGFSVTSSLHQTNPYSLQHICHRCTCMQIHAYGTPRGVMVMMIVMMEVMRRIVVSKTIGHNHCR